MATPPVALDQLNQTSQDCCQSVSLLKKLKTISLQRTRWPTELKKSNPPKHFG